MAGDERLSREDLAALEPVSHAALYRLATWLSPAYPVGGFAYSSGIEWAVEAGDIVDRASLLGWLTAVLTEGAGFNDAVLMAAAHRAAGAGDDTVLSEAAELASALVPTRERHLETTTLGRAFMDVTMAAWACGALTRLKNLWDGPIAYPVAVGVACAGHDIPIAAATHAFLAAVTANWISAAVRLVPLGHTDSQLTLSAIEPVVTETARRAIASTLDDLGSATFRADLASARHETQYTRLFRS
ncbi:MAG TPA: urease accessory UreF family protein [Pseudorhodoplanes sp.]|nr:urease accessory UreF family protein [Pseudorhodoplanes sp.]